METKDALVLLANSNGVSGQENNLHKVIIELFESLVDEVEVDSLGNLIFYKKSTNKSDFKLMLAAHMDEIGLIVNKIEENGFLRFSEVGGIDKKTLVGQEVLVHGKETILGIIGTKPPHMMSNEEQEKSIKIEDMIIDTGFNKEEVEKIVKIGDFITIRREAIVLENERISGKSMDDRVGVVVLYDIAKRLQTLKHNIDVYFVCTVQEELTMSGGMTSTYKINPDIGIAIDVGFGYTPELKRNQTLLMGHGPGIALGGNIDSSLRNKIINIAKELNIPYQINVVPGQTGTDARSIQITREGIPTLLISIPLRYMHTSVELVDLKDVSFTSILISEFIRTIGNKPEVINDIVEE